MIRRVGPYSTLITPQAGSLFHAVFQLLKKWQGDRLRLVAANLASWAFASVLGGYVMAIGRTFTFEAAALYALPQLAWLVMDLVLWKRAHTPIARAYYKPE